MSLTIIHVALDAKPIDNEQAFGENQMEKSFRKFLTSILPEGTKDFDFETLNQSMLAFINKNIEEGSLIL